MSNTGQLINREALLGRDMPIGCDSSEADPGKSAVYNFILGYETAKLQIVDMIRDEPAIDAEKVTRCRDCQHCQPYKQDIGFYCEAWDMDFFSPAYDPATYFCADAKPREGAASA